MNDNSISRQAALDAIDEIESEVVDGDGFQYEKWRKYFSDLPSAEPERKRGKWNCGDDMFEYAICSACKWDSGEAWEYAKKYFKYCPNCGAEMEKGEADD